MMGSGKVVKPTYGCPAPAFISTVLRLVVDVAGSSGVMMRASGNEPLPDPESEMVEEFPKRTSVAVPLT